MGISETLKSFIIYIQCHDSDGSDYEIKSAYPRGKTPLQQETLSLG